MKKMMIVLGTLAVMHTAHARPCRNLDNNSCWHARNQTNQPIELSCSYFERTTREIFVTGPIAAEGIFSYQFDQGWADGLGFAVSPVDCQVDFGRTIKKVHIPEMPFGAHITFVVEPNRLKAIVYNSWGRSYRREYESNP